MGNIEEKEKAKRDYSFKRLFRTFFLLCQKWAIWPGVIRYRFIKMGGCKIGEQCFIGSDVTFDTLNPKGISIGKGTTITSGSKIITHYYSPAEKTYYFGNVEIGEDVFIGMNALIINAVTIGNNAVIGAGSVVVKSVPENEIWAGNPAHFIKKIGE